MPLAHDMVGLYFAVGNANHLPPWGGLEMLLSTNPIAAAIPAGAEPPIVLDMATTVAGARRAGEDPPIARDRPPTVASYGRVKVRAARGEPMPEGWMVDRQG